MRKTQIFSKQMGKRALAFVMTLALLLGMLPVGTHTFQFAAKAAKMCIRDSQNTDENVIMVTDTGLVFPVSVGQANVIVRVVKGDLNLTATITFDIRTGKTEASYYTPERVQAIRDNIKAVSYTHLDVYKRQV